MNFALPLQIENLFQSLHLVHLIAIAVGVAATLAMDFFLTRLCGQGRITKRLYLKLRMINKVSIFATMVLWSTLMIQMSYFSVDDPSALMAQDLWARISIVVVLSLNLYLIRRYALPKAKRRIGLSIYGGLSDRQMNRMLGLGAVSSISWVALMILMLLNLKLLPVDLTINYFVVMALYAGSLIMALMFCKFCGKWARTRFFENLEQKQNRYRKLTRTVARRTTTVSLRPE